MRLTQYARLTWPDVVFLAALSLVAYGVYLVAMVACCDVC